MLKPLQNASSVADEDDNAISRRCSVSSISIDMPSAETRQKLLMRWVRQWLPIAPVVGRPEQQVSTNEVFPLASGNGTGDWHPLTINHESMYKDAWDTVVIIVVVADAFIAPFAASFDYNTSAVTAFANLETLVYGLDMVVQMMSSYTDEHGTVITGPRKTIPHYGVAMLIASIDEEEDTYKKKMISTSERCKFLGIPDKLARRIQTYYEHLYRETKTINGDS
ncbi:TPA: hypothetical protein N0F65_001160, partial [Lagenidium giganteum]